MTKIIDIEYIACGPISVPNKITRSKDAKANSPSNTESVSK